jgi:hypothetical protein
MTIIVIKLNSNGESFIRATRRGLNYNNIRRHSIAQTNNKTYVPISLSVKRTTKGRR